MPLERIDSLADPRLAVYRDLKQTNLTRWSGSFIAEGEKLVVRLLRSTFTTESVLVDDTHLARLQEQATLPPDVPVYVVPDRCVPELVGFNFHRGVLACGHRKPRLGLETFLADRPPRLTLVVLPDVQNPENLGSILRTSLVFGVDAVVLGERSADPFSRRVLRVSMGAALEIPIVESENLAADLRTAHQRLGIEIAATVVDPSAEPLAEATRPDRLALLFGSEGHGLDDAWLRLCHRRLTIPINSQADSLNVAIAAGIFLHHFQRP